MQLDFVVVGAGPAGSAAAARLAQRGAAVALVEASHFGQPRIGEALGLAAQRALGDLGFDSSVGVGVPGHRPLACWGSPQLTGRPAILAPHGLSWVVDRQAFDRALFRHAGLQGSLLLSGARVFSPTRVKGVWQFDIVCKHRRIAATARTAIEATGRSGHSAFPVDRCRRFVDRLVALSLTIPAHSTPAPAPVVRAFADGWTYCATLPSNQRVCMVFSDADILSTRRDHLLAVLHDLIGDWSCEFARLRPKVFDARSSFRRVASQDGWFAVGDALMAVDPLSGRGIGDALGTAIAAAEWATEGPGVEPHSPPWLEEAAESFNTFIARRSVLYGIEQRWPNSRFWLRRHQQAPMAKESALTVPMPIGAV